MILKRIFDFISGIILLIALSPIMIVCAILVKFSSCGPIFFRQQRLGYKGQTFNIFKFRTMVQHEITTLSDGIVTEKDPRITKIGYVLRKYRLDELPQLFNVVLGQMSLVGPRPLMPELLYAYSEYDKRRLEAIPGMTGWQQINGGSEHTWEERINYDVWYVDHKSFWLDIKILFMTIWIVINPKGVYGKDGKQISGVPTALIHVLKTDSKAEN